MNLEDKAKEQPTVHLANSLTESVYRLETTELVAADDLTDEDEFPKYGDFLETTEFSPVDGTERGVTFIEVPGALARWLVDNEAGVGDRFRVLGAEKQDDGTWSFDCSSEDGSQQKSLEKASEAMGDD